MIAWFAVSGKSETKCDSSGLRSGWNGCAMRFRFASRLRTSHEGIVDAVID
ncbi:hypothetical protein SAMN04487905_1258 [Actinopolyspora xinjiangensis]|uniref:Uncharacterized protein n=1 Tax=Actinopolyspora xinjiangensis TaxID=405564 RepID=A0A1H0X2X5_9ACTN|nr:hypothetical protein SAMN04487905_1258 [Actinopolyspora xinjiangensis]